MNKIIVTAVNPNGRLALKNYCEKFRSAKPSFSARAINKVLPFREEVDDLDNPSKIVVTLSKLIQAQGYVLIPKIRRNIFNILIKFGGKEKDFKVVVE
jgi:hypothetical protein